MEKIKPDTIYTLGDYYRTSLLRELCHSVKDCNSVSNIRLAGRLLAALIPNDVILVPIPCCSARNYTDRLVQEIAACKWKDENERKNHVRLQVLGRDSNDTLYEMKISGKHISEEDCKFVLTGEVPKGDIVLVDNVLATGTSASAAMRLIGRRCNVATIAVDFEKQLHEKTCKLSEK